MMQKKKVRLNLLIKRSLSEWKITLEAGRVNKAKTQETEEQEKEQVEEERKLNIRMRFIIHKFYNL